MKIVFLQFQGLSRNNKMKMKHIKRKNEMLRWLCRLCFLLFCFIIPIVKSVSCHRISSNSKSSQNGHYRHSNSGNSRKLTSSFIFSPSKNNRHAHPVLRVPVLKRKDYVKNHCNSRSEIYRTFLLSTEQEFPSSSSSSSSSEIRKTPKKIKRSAFGKAAIGQKDELETNTNINGARNNNGQRTKVANRTKRKTRKSTLSSSSLPPQNIENILERRDNALLAFKTHLRLSLDTSLEILNSQPRLCTELPDLNSKLLYLLNDINIKPKQLKRMLLSHPRLMETVLLDSEDNITNTIEVLQTELDLSLEDIKMIQSNSLPAILSYPRSELRKRILVYKLDLSYPKKEITKMVWKDPRMLRTDSKNVRQILNVFREELDINKEDVHTMLGKEILLLTYNAEDNILPTIRYLKESEVGKCLGMVERKKQSTLYVSDPIEKHEIICQRLKSLIMGHPKILSSSIEKNLKPTVAFFLGECGLSEYEFGKVLYRRGGSLLEANLERTLKRKVAFFRENLGLEIDEGGDDIDDDGDVNNKSIQVEIPPLEKKSPSSSSSTATLTNFQKKRLLAQMLSINPDILTFSIENNLQPKIEYFTKSIGFTKEQLRYVLLKRPQLLALSLERNIIPKVEYFCIPRSTQSNKKGGLGMSREQVCDWLSQNPQTLALTLESRIIPRVNDVVELGLFVGVDIPLNFLTQTERNWKIWKDGIKR